MEATLAKNAMFEIAVMADGRIGSPHEIERSVAAT